MTAHESELGVNVRLRCAASSAFHVKPSLPLSEYWDVLHAVSHVGAAPVGITTLDATDCAPPP